MKRLLVAAFVAAFVACALHAAEDRTVEAGADETLAADATYARLTVLGKLTIAENVTVTLDTLAATNALGETAEIVLKDGSRLAASGKWMIGGAGTFRVTCEGGTAAFTSLDRGGTGTNIFEGVDAPIRLELNGDDNAFDFASKTPRVILTGNGGFERTGNKETVICLYTNVNNLVMNYSGDTVLKSGVYNHQGAPFPKTTDLKIEKNGRLISFGGAIEVKSLTGEGVLREGDYDYNVTLQGGAFDRMDTTRVKLYKTGSDTLTVAPRNAFRSVSVQGGTLAVKSRQEAGFGEYQFAVSAVRAGTNGDQVFSEFYAYDNAGADIIPSRASDTGTVQDGWTSALYDRNFGTKWWAKCPATLYLRFATVMPLKTYNWRTCKDSANYDPISWTLSGCVDYSYRHLMTLASVKGHATPSSPRAQLASTSDFAVNDSIREVTSDTFTVSPGARVSVVGETTLVPSGFKATGGTFALDAAARLALGSDTDETVNYITTTGAGTLEKRGAGTLTLRGATLGTPIDVRAGTLALANGYAQTNTWFKFVILSNRWNVANGGTSTETQFSKIRFYDASFTAYSAGWNGSIGGAWPLFSSNDLTDGCYATVRPLEIPAKPNGKNIVAYRFADYTSKGSSAKTPAIWQVYAGNAETGPWTLIDERHCITTDGVRGWNAYNGGEYFYFTNKCSATAAAFAGDTSVTLARGTTLDVRESPVALAKVALDLTGEGDAATLNGGSLAAAGTLNVVAAEKPTGTTALLAFASGATAEDLSDWTIQLNGQALKRHRLLVKDNMLYLNSPGLIVIVK